MKSLQIGDRNNHHNNGSRDMNDLPQINAQIAISTLKHRMAVRKALNMINERIQDPPTLAELASFSGLSRTYLSYIFKEVTGMRLQDYLIQVRLNKAKELLSQIDLKVKQIAYEVGFTDPNYFCRAFKKKVGLNPTNWRLREILSDKNYHPLEERFRMGSM